MSSQLYDVVVVGGGPTGIAAALTLNERGASVLVVERSLYAEARIGETFPPEIQRVLVQLKLWEDFKRAGYVASAGIRSFWGGPDSYEQSFIFNPYGNGWHVDRRAFDAAIARAANERGVRLACGSRLLACEQQESGEWSLRVASRESAFDARARFILDATGRASILARRFGATRIAYDQLVGIYGFFKKATASARPEPFTLIEAAELGWWYCAPLPGDNLLIAFMTDADLYPHTGRRSASHWKAQLELAPHTQERAAQFTLDREPRIVAASTGRLSTMFGKGWVAAGDAAFACDPLSGDGVFRALLAGRRSASAILAEQAGDESALPQYAEALKKEFEAYLRTRQMYYSREGRWPESLFWARRRELLNKL